MRTTTRWPALVAGAGLVYLSGGNPPFLARTLRGTRVWSAIEAAWRGGAALAGCSAGAMALTGQVPDIRHPLRDAVPGLGAVPQLSVLPHFDRFAGRLPDLVLTKVSNPPPGVTAVGIDEDTALVGGLRDDPGEWEVHGPAVGVGAHPRRPAGAPRRVGPAPRPGHSGRPSCRRSIDVPGTTWRLWSILPAWPGGARSTSAARQRRRRSGPGISPSSSGFCWLTAVRSSVKVRPDSPRIAACVEVQRRMFQAGYPCPEPLTGARPSMTTSPRRRHTSPAAPCSRARTMPRAPPRKHSRG